MICKVLCKVLRKVLRKVLCKNASRSDLPQDLSKNLATHLSLRESRSRLFIHQINSCQNNPCKSAVKPCERFAVV